MTDGPDQTQPDDRAAAQREPRQSVFLAAKLERFGSAETTEHRVRDLSSKGMRINQTAGLKVGATVLVSIGVLEAVGATIVWIKGDSAGLRFAKAVDPDQARAKAAMRPKTGVLPGQAGQGGATIGWVADLDDPYRR